MLTLLILLQVVSVAAPGSAMTAEAASAKVRFASSIRLQTLSAAKKQKATSRIAVAKVNNYTYLYRTASTGSRVIGYMYRGSGAYIIRRKKNFYYVTSGNAKGWVKAASVVTGKAASRYVAKTNPRVATVKTAAPVVAGTSKNVVLASAAKGKKLTVLASGKTWVRVRVNCNTLGYIRRSAVKIEKGLYTAVTSAEDRALQGQDSNKTTDSDEVDPNTVPDQKKIAGNWKSLGTFRLTAYCPGACCNGQWAGQTATGVTPTPGRTIAVDRRVIPLGSKIRIEGDDTIYIAEDTGVSGKHIDVLVANHGLTTQFGVKYKNVYILEN